MAAVPVAPTTAVKSTVKTGRLTGESDWHQPAATETHKRVYMSLNVLKYNEKTVFFYLLTLGFVSSHI